MDDALIDRENTRARRGVLWHQPAAGTASSGGSL
jgi:hypothetical protein